MSRRCRRFRSVQVWLILFGLALAAALQAGCGGDSDGQEATTTSATTTTSDGLATTDPTPSSSSSTSDPTATTAAADGGVQVWFSSGDGSDCGAVAAVTRVVAAAADPMEVAFDALVAGPTAEEQSAGVGSFFSAETADALESVTLRDDGLLIVDLIDIRPLIPNASTSCGSLALRAQLDATSFQFDEVERARYRIQGSCDEFGNFLQTECFDSDRSGAQLPVPTNERASGSGCTPPTSDGLPDGRWYGLVDIATEDQLSFDLACWFSGTGAAAAAAEDGEESPPPNDYHVRNDNEALRTFDVAPGAAVTWYPDGGDPANVTTVGYGRWLLDREDRPFQLAVWLTVEAGVIESITEQWVP